ncbi:hypothetical protein KKB84_04235 [bacterium]|nr:hypothetical protein [bacterium]MBU1782308.1 hypothetical protein [bacterium]MBU2599781.1 hypothetical protein [bacterium]
MPNYIYKTGQMSTEGEVVIVETKKALGTSGGSVLTVLSKKIEETQNELLRLQREINKATTRFDHLKENIIQEGNYEKGRMMEEATKEAEAIILEAERRKEEVFEQAYAEGFKKGEDEGFKKGEDEATSLIHQMKEIITNAESKRCHIIKEAEEDIIELAVLIAKKIVKSELTTNREIVVKNVREALKRVAERDEITIKVNLTDLKLTKAHEEEFLRDVAGVKKINIKDDLTITPGGCKIETDFGGIDANLDTQLEEIKKSLKKVSEELEEELEKEKKDK